jgi:hypothetical protein
MKKTMKKFNLILLAFFALAACVDLSAQNLPAPDASPMDIAWLPKNRQNPVAKVIYSRPQKKGRTMLGGTEPYGKVWRLGANESTEIKLFKDVTIGDKLVKAGTYTMYAIPTETEWTIIVNSKLDTWGAYAYDEKMDVARIKVPVGKADKEIESFTIGFDDVKDNASTMNIAWENTLVKVPVKF